VYKILLKNHSRWGKLSEENRTGIKFLHPSISDVYNLLCSILQLTFFLSHLERPLVNKCTNKFTTALYCHRFKSCDFIGRV